MHTFIEGDIITHGTRLHYYRTGGAKPPMVLIHGITDDGLCWTPIAQVLSGTYDVIMVDLRGHGKSEAPDEGYNYEAMATEVAGLITGLALEKPVVIGHSLGAMTAMTLASLNPDLPRAIILEDPPAFWNLRRDDPEGAEFRTGMRMRFNELKRKTHDDLLEIIRKDHPQWPDAEIEPWVNSKHRFSIKITQMIEPRDAIPVDFPALLSQITCPVLLITADSDLGAIVKDEDVAKLIRSVTHLKREHIPRAGHSIRREQFSRYAEVVQNFLEELP